MSSLTEVTKTDKSRYSKSLALAAITGDSELTLRKKKALNTIAFVVREQFFLRNPEISEAQMTKINKSYIEETNTTFEIPEDYLMSALGYRDKTKYYSYNQVLTLLKEVADETLGFDALGEVRSKAEKETWDSFTKIIASAEREDGHFRIHVPPMMVLRLVKPEISFDALTDWSTLKSKHSPEIIDICMYYHQNGNTETDWYELDTLRKLMGATSKTYDQFYRFNDKYLKSAVDDINNAADIGLLVEIETASSEEDDKKSRGRKKVSRVRFRFREKSNAGKKVEIARLAMTINTQKTELRSLGIANNQLDLVVDECRDEDGVVITGFLKWAIKRGHELRKLSKYKVMDSNRFGGVFRNEVIRGRKEQWVDINNAIIEYMGNVTIKDLSNSVLAEMVTNKRKEIEKEIVVYYLKELSEIAYSHVKEEFKNFFKREFPSMYNDYSDLEGDITLMDLDGYPFYVLKLYIDLHINIFSVESYLHLLEKK